MGSARMEDCRPCFLFTKHFFLISSRHVIIKPNNPPGLPAGVHLHIYFLKLHMDCNIYSIEMWGHFGWETLLLDFRLRQTDTQTTVFTVDHSYPQTYIHTFLAIYFSLLLSFSPTRLSGECLSVIQRGLGGQIAIYSLPVGEVCVSRL